MLASQTIPNSTAETILEILSKAKNVILDEVHELQFGEAVSYAVYNERLQNLVNIDRYTYMLQNEFKYLRRVISKFSLIMKEERIQTTVHEVLDGSMDNVLETPLNSLSEKPFTWHSR